ncbi:MAG: hypothetical protein E3J35_09450 [Methanomassiliicoccales archaeon]|nr:MAG: hypothetical protein E3J35_09450 [Methanomassiliicoccales archaeon]
MDDDVLGAILKRFAELLDDRFSKEVFTTEDSVRYTLFYCLIREGGIHPSDVILEHPHPQIPRAEVDLFIPPKDGSPGLVFEFKFDREMPSGRNQNKTQKAGKLFADIYRLNLFAVEGNIRRFFVYVTDREMAVYFRNPSNALQDFFGLKSGEALTVDRSYIETHPKTFVDSAGAETINCDLAGRLNEDLESQIWVRVYETMPRLVSSEGV